MALYDDFASFYDRVMGDRLSEGRDVKKLLARHVTRRAHVLELGCGTGTMLKQLVRLYEVTGIDLSAEMLLRARQKVPDATLYCQDIASFSVEDDFDAIICVFDTMNHLLKFSMWKGVFARAAQHLRPDGVFIFDINTLRKLNRYAEEPAYAEERDGAMAIFDIRKGGRNSFEVNIDCFSPISAGDYRREQVSIPESAFEVADIKKALKPLFRTIQLWDPEREKPTNDSEELYFICKGPRR